MKMALIDTEEALRNMLKSGKLEEEMEDGRQVIKSC